MKNYHHPVSQSVPGSRMVLRTGLIMSRAARGTASEVVPLTFVALTCPTGRMSPSWGGMPRSAPPSGPGDALLSGTVISEFPS